jgi:phosphoglycerol transferase MdoB-like AlkP superfamily enzyme
MQSLSPINRTTLERPTFTEKPNILIVQLESVPSWAINNTPTPMPFLKNLIEDNVTVPEYYSTSCETINAEFTSLCSFWPNATEPISYSHLNNDFYCLPHILRERDGYRSYFFHANVAEIWRRDVLIPKWGFDEWHFSPEYRQREYDGTVFEKAVATLKTSTAPFFAYFTTYTSHAPHNEDFMIYHRNEDGIDIHPFTEAINADYAEAEISFDEIRYYYGFLAAEDQALIKLFDELSASGLEKNTIVIIHTDHKYYNFNGQDALKNFYLTNKLPFAIIFPNQLAGEIQPLASSLDIAPTILDLVEQENYAKPANFLGESLFDRNYRPTVYNKCLGNTYFLNQNLLIQGNTRTNQYQILENKATTADGETALWQKLLTDFQNFTDSTLYENKLGR